ncbi:YqaJ viral recombinase family protein [Endozoicomonas acroporae]|uniref:YqaJ viral recombinase family protein n=1 Tax=Endozoicomonas acroporae TaxID=1701104 RepID=UPI000C790EDD|nr:YqaJ viral recombinase family protein [Endozoicomonas acroporae]
MKEHTVEQGSPEWLTLRQNYFTASEAPAMMGDSPFTTRDQLLHQKKTGSVPEVTEFQQKKFDEGHAAEESVRPLADAIAGRPLFPTTGTVTIDGLPLLASFDGITFDNTLVFEHKLWNEKLVAQIEGEGIEPAYYWQLEQQLLVSGAERVLFVCSDGSAANLRHVYYESQEHRRAALIAGWQQFQADLESFTPVAPKPVLKGELISHCSVVSINISGQVNQSNLPALEEQISNTVKAIKSELVSDQDFADAETAVAFLNDTEDKLKAGKAMALSQVPDIASLFDTIDRLQKQIKSKRTSLKNQITNNKKHLKDSMVLAAITALEEDRQAINKTLHPAFVPQVAAAADFQEVIKGKKKTEKMQSAINDRLAEARIELKRQAAALEKNLAVYNKLAIGKDYLFPDLDLLLHKDQLDLMAIIEMRLNQESRKNLPANESAPAPEKPAPEKKEDQQDLLYAPEEQKELILASTVKTVEKMVGTSVMDSFRYDRHGNEYGVQVVIRRSGLLTPATQLKLKEA